jgi:hypothetical protein
VPRHRASRRLRVARATFNSACSTGHIGDTTPFNVAALPVTGLSGGLLTSNYRSHINGNILQVGLNYRWAAR